MRFTGRIGRAIDDVIAQNIADSLPSGTCETCEYRGESAAHAILMDAGAAHECPRHFLESVGYWEGREGFTTEWILDHAAVRYGVTSARWSERHRARRAIWTEYAARFRTAFHLAEGAK